ncbi:MAG: T9SS type A sorting domain-containing protein [Cytophagales bacterium]|nr:T9SS type A sorting domain-containing protein [Cytophagales bacterium]
MKILFLLFPLLVAINSYSQCSNNFPLKVQGDSIILNDGTERRFFVSGMVDNNKASGMQLSTYDATEMEEELQSYVLAGCNAMRWNAFLKGIDITWDASNNVSGVKSGCLEALKDGLDRAYKNKIMVQIVLSTAHFQQYGWGGIDNVLGGIRNGDRVDNFYKMFTTDEGTQAYIDNLIKPMIAEIGNHPALMGYVIINEAYGMTDPQDTPFGVWADRTPRLVHFQRYVNKVVSAIHTAQPGALCTVSGVAGARQMYGDAELLAAGGESNGLLDHFQYQYYPIHHKATFSPFLNDLKEMESIWGGDSKPVIAGEFPIEGIETSEYNSVDMTPTEAYETLWGNGYSGGFTWENIIYKNANSTLKNAIDEGYTTFKNNHLTTLDPWEFWNPTTPCKDCNGDDNGFADYDNCGVCSGGNTGIEPNSLCITNTYSLEAEEGTLVGVTEQNSISGYSASGYVGNFKSNGHEVTVTANIESASIHEIWVYYHTPSGNKKLDLLVNGNAVGEVSFNQNATFEKIQVAKVFLTEGTNTITIRKNMGYTYIDKVELISDPVEIITNVDEVSENIEFDIFPNPASDELQVLTSEEIEAFSIFDGTGKSVNQNVNYNSNIIEVSSLENGFYILKCEINGVTYFKKFLKE